MKLQVVKTDKGYVAVKEFTKNYPWYLNYTDGICPNKDFGQGWMVGLRDIVATDTTFKLEGVAQFELEKDELEKMALEYASLPYKNWPKDAQIILLEDNARLDFIAGYKAAQSKGCFTEEDMKSFSKFVTSNLMKHSDENGVYLGIDKVFSMWNQPKKLVAIEVETEIVSKTKVWETGNTSAWQESIPKVNNGLLTIKQYFYEVC